MDFLINHLYFFKDNVYRQCDDMKKAIDIDVSDFISFDDIEEYKSITIQAKKSEPDENGATATTGEQYYYLLKTAKGWKVFDINAVAVFQVITKIQI